MYTCQSPHNFCQLMKPFRFFWRIRLIIIVVVRVQLPEKTISGFVLLRDRCGLPNKCDEWFWIQQVSRPQMKIVKQKSKPIRKKSILFLILFIHLFQIAIHTSWWRYTLRTYCLSTRHLPYPSLIAKPNAACQYLNWYLISIYLVRFFVIYCSCWSYAIYHNATTKS